MSHLIFGDEDQEVDGEEQPYYEQAEEEMPMEEGPHAAYTEEGEPYEEESEANPQ